VSQNLIQPNSQSDTIDRDKLNAIFRKSWPLLILFVIITNAVAFLVLRYTKDTFQSNSELKLEIKSNASEFGLSTIGQDENYNLLSGEIEQIKSRTFLQHVIDSLDIWVSYYSVGNVLDDEMYRRSPYLIEYKVASDQIQNRIVNFEFTADGFQLNFGSDLGTIEGQFEKPLQVFGSELIIHNNPNGTRNSNNSYYFIINSFGALLDYISKNLTVEPLNFNAKTIRISFKDFNPFKAQAVVDKINTLYLLYSNQQKNLTNSQKIDWLDHELHDIEEQMGGYENYFENFTITNRSSDLTEDIKNVIKQIQSIDSQRYFLNKNIVALNNLIEEISKSETKSSYSFISLPESFTKKIDQLGIKRLEKDKLRLTYNENTFAYRQKEQELNSLQDQIFKDLTELRKVWMGRLSDLDKQKKHIEATFTSMPDKNTQYSKNQRYYKLYEQFYFTLMQSKAEFEIALAGNTPDFKILSQANLPTVPISPKRIAIAAVGLVAGGVICFFFLGAAYLLNDKITSIKEIEKVLNIPVLGILPENSTASRVPFYIVENPKSRLSEAIRNLRSNLDFVTVSQKRKVLAISSTISGEGKSFLAQNLAAILALSKKRVILLDLDLRKEKKNLPFTIPDPTKGISTVLIKKNSWQDCLVHTHVEGLDYLTNGPIPPNPAELLMNGEFEALLNELKEVYDFIVLDTPPAGLVIDGVSAIKRADLSIYVFRCNYSKKDYLRTLDRLVQINKINNIALVFNDIIPPPDNGFGYYVEEKKRKRVLNFFRK
jgi:tyrosine-protein kinase Etk/Wzc